MRGLNDDEGVLCEGLNDFCVRGGGRQEVVGGDR